MAILITNDSVPEEQIYEFLTAMYGNLADIAAVHAKGKEITLEGALKRTYMPAAPRRGEVLQGEGHTQVRKRESTEGPSQGGPFFEASRRRRFWKFF